jgi:hypothetical protein
LASTTYQLPRPSPQLVVTAIIVGLLCAFPLGAGLLAGPATVGAELKGSRGKTFIPIVVVFAAASGAIIGLGVYATHGSDDWTPFFVAIGVVSAGFVAVVFILMTILRGLMPKDGSALMHDMANDVARAAQATAGSRLAPERDSRQLPRMRRPLRPYVSYVAYTTAVIIALGLGSVAGAITEILIGRNELPATGVALVVVAAALVPLVRIARSVARGLMTDKA